MKLAAAALGLLLLPASAETALAQTRSTGWITLSEWETIVLSLFDTDDLPIKAECKDTGAKVANARSALVRITFTKNTTGTIDWFWAIADHYSASKARLESRGYELVSYDEYHRASGRKVPCAIWHKR